MAPRCILHQALILRGALTLQGRRSDGLPTHKAIRGQGLVLTDGTLAAEFSLDVHRRSNTAIMDR